MGPIASGIADTDELRFHPVRFEYPADMDVVWHPGLPEFSCAANGVSLLMPFVEPYVVSSVRAVTGELGPPLRDQALTYLRQEGQHHAQHRRFNDLLVARFPQLHGCERLMAACYRRLGDRRSRTFGVAFAAGFETVAYAAARWTAAHERELLDGADSPAAELFLWHLAEEVEHKSVAVDVHRAIGGTKRTYVAAMVASAVLLAVFAWMNTLVMLAATRRIFHPLAHLRMLRWTISFLFELLPAMVLSVFPSSHPSQLADPLLYDVWRREHRPADPEVTVGQEADAAGSSC